jgi:hypothetical protein
LGFLPQAEDERISKPPIELQHNLKRRQKPLPEFADYPMKVRNAVERPNAWEPKTRKPPKKLVFENQAFRHFMVENQKTMPSVSRLVPPFPL